MERKNRLRKEQDFSRVYRKGKRYHNRDFTILVIENMSDTSRFGFSISKKYGKANKRNTTRRRLKEIIRLNQLNFDKGRDYVIIPRPHTVEMEYSQLEKTFLHCMSLTDRKKIRK